ncbi:MAG: cysteine--tRNA ligase [Candidatus Porifericomitaceae bacterium WSBS_2022_MAG_OTU9]
MDIYFHNTIRGGKELFTPQHQGRVSMYVCGPTVYSYPHIGNARSAIVFDVVRRWLQNYYQVVFVRNITDVDDKINQAAQREQVSIETIADRYIDAYHKDMVSIGVAAPSIEPKATAHIAQIIAMIKTLLDLGHAYEAESHVLFAVNSYSGYGKLSGRNKDEMLAGARVEVAPYKKDPGDFVLWKPSDDSQPGWHSPWGRGRPGWHIECSAMARHHLGETIDIHGGGADLVFPHHENELAQSSCASGGKDFARFWLHNGMVHLGERKMSKSESNIILLRDLLQRHRAETIRYAILATHYRSPLEWNEGILLQAQQNLDRLYGAIREVLVSTANENMQTALPEPFVEALANDLNTPAALKELHSLARQINSTSNLSIKRKLAQDMRAAAAVLGLLQNAATDWFTGGGQELPEQAEQLIKQRSVARTAGDYAEADRLRQQLLGMGIEVQDRPDGDTIWSIVVAESGKDHGEKP